MSIEVKVTIKDRLGNLTYVPEHTVVLNGHVEISEFDGAILEGALTIEIEDLLNKHIDNNPILYERIKNKSTKRNVDLIGLHILH